MGWWVERDSGSSRDEKGSGVEDVGDWKASRMEGVRKDWGRIRDGYGRRFFALADGFAMMMICSA